MEMSFILSGLLPNSMWRRANFPLRLSFFGRPLVVQIVRRPPEGSGLVRIILLTSFVKLNIISKKVDMLFQ